MQRIRLAVIGIGNCANSLIQSIYSAKSGQHILGLESPLIGGLRIECIDLVCAFDVTESKVGIDVMDAIWAEPNNSTKYFSPDSLGVKVLPGYLSDGLAGPISHRIKVASKVKQTKSTDIEAALAEHTVDVAVCYLPTGSTEDVRVYAKACAQANVAFVNACPEKVVHDPDIQAAFSQRGVPLLGDDMRSHVGATAVHTALLDFLRQRNITINDTYQLNIGGNSDFLNLSDAHRSKSKRKTKCAALFASGLPETEDVLAGPNGYSPSLRDRKIAFININATSVLGMQLSIDLKLSVEDSPNVVSIIVDAVRLAYLATKGKADYTECLAHLFKHPPVPKSYDQAKRDYRDGIEKIERA